MALCANTATTATLIAFPQGRAGIGPALKRHRLPETLAGALVRAVADFPDLGADAALAYVLDQRMTPAPIDLEKARGILLVGAAGAGKSAVAAKIVHAATLAGRRCEMGRADGGLALFRSRSNPPELLTVMEADGFNPLNARAACAFRALGETPEVETIGIISALSDAEDVRDLMAAFRFRRVIVTNMDRTLRLGAAVAAITGGATLAHVTAGPRPEDALETLKPGALAALLLDAAAH